MIPLLSINPTPLHLVLEWMPGGNVMEYIINHPHGNRLSLVGVIPTALCNILTLSPAIRHRQRSQLPPLLPCDAWRPQGGIGLFQYHTGTVLIPDQSSILVDVDGCAQITDLGLTTISQSLDSKMTVVIVHDGLH